MYTHREGEGVSHFCDLKGKHRPIFAAFASFGPAHDQWAIHHIDIPLHATGDSKMTHAFCAFS